MQIQNDTLKPTKICFGIFLTDKFPLLPLSIMTDTLRIANTLEEKRNFSYVLISADGQSTSSSCEFPAPIEAGINNCPVLDVVLVCTGQGGTKTTNQGVLNWLRKLSRSGVTIGGVSSGLLYWQNQVYWMAASAPCIGQASNLLANDSAKLMLQVIFFVLMAI